MPWPKSYESVRYGKCAFGQQRTGGMESTIKIAIGIAQPPGVLE
jgi:hypothetical protein